MDVKKLKHYKNYSSSDSTFSDEADNKENIQKSFDNEVEISNSESDEENSGLPTNLTTEQLRAIAKKYYKLKSNKQKLKSDNLDSYTEEKDKPNKIDKKNESTREEIDKNINIKKEVDEIENKQLEVVSTKTNENDIMGKEEIKDANAQQLLQFWSSDDMIHLQDGIFCKQKILDYAIGSSHKASHVARKLLEGIFHESALLHCTYTGQAPRAMGITNEKGIVSCLHNKAKNTILTFAKDLAKQRGWMEQTDEKIRRAMSQRLGEIKRDRKKLK